MATDSFFQVFLADYLSPVMIQPLIKLFFALSIICQVVLAFISLALAQQALIGITNGSEDPAICFHLAAGRTSAGDAKAGKDQKVQIGWGNWREKSEGYERLVERERRRRGEERRASLM